MGVGVNNVYVCVCICERVCMCASLRGGGVFSSLTLCFPLRVCSVTVRVYICDVCMQACLCACALCVCVCCLYVSVLWASVHVICVCVCVCICPRVQLCSCLTYLCSCIGISC